MLCTTLPCSLSCTYLLTAFDRLNVRKQLFLPRSTAVTIKAVRMGNFPDDSLGRLQPLHNANRLEPIRGYLLNPSSLNHKPKSQTPNPKPQTPKPKPQNPNPKPQTPNPKPQTPNPKPQTLGLERGSASRARQPRNSRIPLSARYLGLRVCSM